MAIICHWWWTPGLLLVRGQRGARVVTPNERNKLMPGTIKLELYSMDVTDALTLLALGDNLPVELVHLGVTAAEIEELRRAAIWVVERHAEEIAARHLTPPGRQPNLRPIQGDDHYPRRWPTADDERGR